MSKPMMQEQGPKDWPTDLRHCAERLREGVKYLELADLFDGAAQEIESLKAELASRLSPPETGGLVEKALNALERRVAVEGRWVKEHSGRPYPYGAGMVAVDELAIAALRSQGEDWAEPTPGLLVSMAIRYDHSLGLPGNEDRLRATIVTMRQLHEEVVGKGFYSPDKEDAYASRLAPGRTEEGS